MKKLLTLVVIVLLLLLAVGGWWKLQLSPVSAESEVKSIIIPKGQSVSATAEQLQKENLIRSSLAFKIYIRQKNIADKRRIETKDVSDKKCMCKNCMCVKSKLKSKPKQNA